MEGRETMEETKAGGREGMRLWRIGTKIPINVYDGDRPVCQCQTVMDARLIVAAVNEHLERIADKAKPVVPKEYKL